MSDEDTGTVHDEPNRTPNLRDSVTAWANFRERPCLVIKTGIPRSLSVLCCTLVGPLDGFGAIDVIVDSNGGNIESAFEIVRLLRDRFDAVSCVVPTKAKSAATLICLGADEIILGTLGELGPLDVQMPETREGEALKFSSALNQFRALDQLRRYSMETLDLAVNMMAERTGGMKMAELIGLGIEFSSTITRPLLSKVDPTRIGESARALEVAVEYGVRVLKRYMGYDDHEAQTLLQRLVYEYPSHSFILDTEELSDLGLVARGPVDTEEKLMGDLEYTFSIDDNMVVDIFMCEPNQESIDEPGVESQEETESNGTDDQSQVED